MIRDIFTNNNNVKENIENIFDNTNNTTCFFKQPTDVALKVVKKNTDKFSVTDVSVYRNVKSIAVIYDKEIPHVNAEISIVTSDGYVINTKMPNDFNDHCISCELINVNDHHIDAVVSCSDKIPENIKGGTIDE